jgi:hypothetical protein
MDHGFYAVHPLSGGKGSKGHALANCIQLQLTLFSAIGPFCSLCKVHRSTPIQVHGPIEASKTVDGY